ncbi:MAG: hypothetical protein KAY78_00975 [Pseudomonadales bacterium]|nr:hypothetical protein [Pseudomonadales bacterium]
MTRIRRTRGSTEKIEDDQQQLEAEPFFLMGDIVDVHRAASKPKPSGSVLCNTHQGLCDKQWPDLIATSDPQQRYCLSCANNVQLVKTYKQLTALRNAGLCVAYDGVLPPDKRLAASRLRKILLFLGVSFLF